MWNLKHIDILENLEAHNGAQQMGIEVFVMKVDAPMYLSREALSKEVQFLLKGKFPRKLSQGRSMHSSGRKAST